MLDGGGYLLVKHGVIAKKMDGSPFTRAITPTIKYHVYFHKQSCCLWDLVINML